jgi:hypothetical protein
MVTSTGTVIPMATNTASTAIRRTSQILGTDIHTGMSMITATYILMVTSTHTPTATSTRIDTITSMTTNTATNTKQDFTIRRTPLNLTGALSPAFALR